MHALVLLCINRYTKFEVPSFTNYKDMIGAKFYYRSCDSDQDPFRGGLSPCIGQDFIQSTCTQNFTIPALVVPQISLGASKFKVGHMILTTPFLMVVCHLYTGT